MYRPTTIDDLTSVVDTEREALIAAAILPHLPDGDVLVRVRDEDAPPSKGSEPGVLEEFERRVPTVGGSKNLRRVEWGTIRGHAADTIDEACEDAYELKFGGSPHRIKTFKLSLYDVDVIAPAEDPDAYDFDDTDQAFLSDFGVRSVIYEAIHVGVGSTDSMPGDGYDRKPLFPA